MATYSSLTIVNKALILCGASKITALSDDTPNARITNEIYDISRKDILAECGWTFAVTRSSLATSSVTQPWSYAEENVVYSKPANLIRILGTNDSDAIYRLEGDYIMSDVTGLGIKYIFDQTDASKFTPLFVSAFVDKLAYEICYQILQSSTQAEAFLTKYEKVSLPKAMAVDAQTGTQQNPKDDYWEGAKFGTFGDPSQSYD